MDSHSRLDHLPRRAEDLAILCEIGEILNSSLELDEILRMILVGVTAGQGLRFNRAFLALVDERERCLLGQMAIGPDDAEEAAKLWTQLDSVRLSLREILLTRGGTFPNSGGARVREVVSRLRVPLEDQSHILVRSLSHGGARVVSRDGGQDVSSQSVAILLGAQQFALVPIHSRSGPVGVLLADNAITRSPIDETDLHILRLFANYAGTAIEKARLYQKIREEKEELEAAHADLRHNQMTLLRLQRLSDLGEMAARVAHEIRNPLVAIGGFARQMLATTEASDPRHKRLKIIVNEVRRLEIILREVLDYGRPLKLSADRLHPNSIVGESLEMVDPERAALGIELTQSLDETCGEITSDKRLLRMAILNVLRNALHAAAHRENGGGRVSVTTHNLGGTIQIRVQDNGPGISREDQARIFDPFFTTKPAGSGLGLSIVTQILKEHRGNVSFESEPGKGTVFYLDIPFEKGSAT